MHTDAAPESGVSSRHARNIGGTPSRAIPTVRAESMRFAGENTSFPGWSVYRPRRESQPVRTADLEDFRNAAAQAAARFLDFAELDLADRESGAFDR